MSAESRKQLLADVAAASLVHANRVAEDVPAVPAHSTPNGDGATDYPVHHHLVSANPEQDQQLVNVADRLLA